MIQERQRPSVVERVGLVTSLAGALLLVLLLHRTLRAASVQPGLLVEADALLVMAGPRLPALEQGFLLAIAATCVWAVIQDRRSALTWLQAYALSLALLMTQYRLGEVPEKIDVRGLLAFGSGLAGLYSCYLCLLAHAAIGIRRAKRARAHTRS